MKGQWKKLCCMTTIVCILASIFTVNTSAASKKTELSTQKISDKNVSHYPKVGVDIGGVMLSDSALLIHDTTYVTLRSFSDRLTSADIDYSRWTRTATVVAGGLVLTASDGAYVVEANGRALVGLSLDHLRGDLRSKIRCTVQPRARRLDLPHAKLFVDARGKDRARGLFPP